MSQLVRKGTRFGDWRVDRIFKVGKFTYVDITCGCGGMRSNVPLGMLTNGKSTSCLKCFIAEKRAALQKVFARRRALAKVIRERFQWA